jgi:hypothetical protein
MQTERAQLSLNSVETELRIGGFEIVNRNDQFLNQPARGAWWLIIARKP